MAATRNVPSGRVSSPTCQRRKVSNVAWWLSRIALVSAVSPADTAAPVRASVTGRAPPRAAVASPYTATMATAEPSAASHSWFATPDSPNSAPPVTTANAAPAVSPRIPGSPSGLRVAPCSSAPATDRAAPVSTPAAVRHTRDSTTAPSSGGTPGTAPGSPPKTCGTTRHVLARSIGREPHEIDRTTATRRTTAMTSHGRTRRPGRSAEEPRGAWAPAVSSAPERVREVLAGTEAMPPGRS